MRIYLYSAVTMHYQCARILGYLCTLAPAFSDPSDERSTAVHGHFGRLPKCLLPEMSAYRNICIPFYDPLIIVSLLPTSTQTHVFSMNGSEGDAWCSVQGMLCVPPPPPTPPHPPPPAMWGHLCLIPRVPYKTGSTAPPYLFSTTQTNVNWPLMNWLKFV